MSALAVYVHIPFCTVKCGYCDFNAYAGMHDLADDYTGALLAEVDDWADVLDRATVASVFFGGGTPSEVPAAHIAAVLDAIGRRASLDPGAEVSLEANPGTIDLAQLRDLRAAGVNRLSLGAQSFDPGELRFLDRLHSPEANATALGLARRAGFESVSLDLIYALPGQPLDRWGCSLDRALELEPDHLSLYALTVEEGTPLAHRVERGVVAEPDADHAADCYLLACERLAAVGFDHYEVSNWARLGHASRHNQTYWTDRPYLGIGAGAHGYTDGVRYANVAHPRAYIAALAVAPTLAEVHGRPRAAVQSVEPPDPRVDLADWLALRLRTAQGVDPADFVAAFGVAFDDVFGDVVEPFRAGGLLTPGPNVALSERGMLMHGELAARITAHLDAMPAAAVPRRQPRAASHSSRRTP